MNIRNSNLIHVYPPRTQIDSSFTFHDLTDDTTVGDIQPDQLSALFEAATWTPGYNIHPWRFVYATRRSPQWKEFVRFAEQSGRHVACSAAAIVLVVVRKNFRSAGDEKCAHLFHLGSVWQSIVCTAQRVGVRLQNMGIGDSDEKRALVDLGVPYNYRVVTVLAANLITPDGYLGSYQSSSSAELFNLAFDQDGQREAFVQ